LKDLSNEAKSTGQTAVKALGRVSAQWLPPGWPHVAAVGMKRNPLPRETPPLLRARRAAPTRIRRGRFADASRDAVAAASSAISEAAQANQHRPA
jgi:hypothetical protein